MGMESETRTRCLANNAYPTTPTTPTNAGVQAIKNGMASFSFFMKTPS